MQEIKSSNSQDLEAKVKEAEKSITKYVMVACKNCNATRKTLIKATDSYYCIDCFKKLNKQRYIKRG